MTGWGYPVRFAIVPFAQRPCLVWFDIHGKVRLQN